MNKSLVALSLVGLAAVAADTCDPSELVKFTPVVSDPNLSSCQEAGSFDLIGGLPSADQIKKMCGADACTKFFQTIQNLSPKDCDIEVGGMKFNIASLGKNFQSICGSSSGNNSPSPSSQAPSPSPTPANDEESDDGVKPQC